MGGARGVPSFLMAYHMTWYVFFVFEEAHYEAITEVTKGF